MIDLLNLTDTEKSTFADRGSKKYFSKERKKPKS